MPAEFTGSAEETIAYSAAVRAEADFLRASITENRHLVIATRACVAETRVAVAWLNKVLP